jgi:hypothetical protein
MHLTCKDANFVLVDKRDFLLSLYDVMSLVVKLWDYEEIDDDSWAT